MHLISLYVSAEQKVYSILCVIPTVKHWMVRVREFVIISATEFSLNLTPLSFI